MTVKWEGATLQVSNSEIQTFKDCRRRWFLTYYKELGLKRQNGKAVGARQLGTRVHTALHVLYANGENPIQALDEIYAHDIREALDTLPNGEDVKIELQKEQELAKLMVGGFLEWREEEGLDEGMELIAAETVIEVPSTIEGVNLRGKLDQRWSRKRDNAKLFRDWKTVGDLNTPQIMLPMDEQFKYYMLLEKLQSLAAGKDGPQWATDGGQYTMLRKVKRTAGAKPPFYQSIEVQHNAATLNSMWRRVIKVIEEIVETRQHLDALGDTDEAHQYLCPPRPSRDCTWKCDFISLCSLMDDGSNWRGLAESYYTHVDPHERYNAEDTGRDVTS